MNFRYDVKMMIAIIRADLFIDEAHVSPGVLHQYRSDEYREMLGRFPQTILASQSSEAKELSTYIQKIARSI